MPRVKRVFRVNELAHIFAQQELDWGRSSSTSFEGTEFRSCHTRIAKIWPTDAGPATKVMLLSSFRHSPPTGRHLYQLRRAWDSHGELYSVPYPIHGPEEPRNLAHLERLVVNEMARIRRATVYFQLDQLHRLIGACQGYCRAFNLPARDWQAELDALNAYLADRERRLGPGREARRLRAERIRAREQQEWRERQMANADRWRAGEHVYAILPDGSAMLRKSGDQVETSQGARVPLADAERLFRLVLSCVRKGEGFFPLTIVRVGDYILGRIDADGTTRVGCHTFQWYEIARFGEEMGW